ncbi:TPA: c-type cytochrome [Legionella pneumophila]|uniref:Cytochrome C n=1 Tax=Legionella pneumophila TaxID=446 RepID=A0A2S6F075_LEGPN|nr:cytochrome c [Legionella pneumophila]APF03344.1 cytochrome C [Legionella pneumophila subsp. fraseri]APF06373.1 cytochrome C [Legionella pneumophila subsp. fraseri]AUB68829.1 cytochrome C [Legionella pneumophila]AUB71801.1 cytochrome C [Legionella pneumophila]KXB23787.1 cytochrome C [Legionella pneumophila]
MKRNALIIMLIYLTSNLAFADNLGKYTYEIACKSCHAPDLAKAIKAPPAFDKKAWKLRFKQAKIEAKNNPSQFETPMDYLLYNVKIGKGLMHHGGLCKEADVPNTDCSDEALIAAINYMRK